MENETKRGGRRKFANAKRLRGKCDEYFERCDQEGRLYGEAGLALHLGVTLGTLRSWYAGAQCPDLQETVQMAYLRIQDQLETDPRWQGKGSASRSNFLNKQPWFGGYQDTRSDAKKEMEFTIRLGSNADPSDLE